MGGSSGAGDQYRIQADQAEANSRLQALQSDIVGVNIGTFQDQLGESLNTFDQAASQQLGTTALQLARSGNLTRRRSRRYASRDELGLQTELIDPLKSIRDSLADTSGELSDLQNRYSGKDGLVERYENTQKLVEDLEYRRDVEIPKKRRELEEELEQVSDTKRQGNGRGGDESLHEYQKRKKQNEERAEEIKEQLETFDEDELSTVEAELEKAQSEFQSIEEERREFENDHMFEDGSFKVEQTQEYLDEVLNTMEEEVADMEQRYGEEQIDEPGALRYAAGSTHTQVSKSLQRLYMERESIFNNGVSGIVNMVQNQTMLDEQSAISEQSAADYMQLASDADINQQVGNALQFGGMALGAILGGALAIPTGGMSLAAGAGLGSSLGGGAGSFLGNAFAR